jgi:indolepyruvate ferredoxin oxidoreductase
MSRYSGCWIAFKCVTDVVESGASVDVDPDRVTIRIPEDFTLPPGGLNIRWPDGILEQEARLLDWKVLRSARLCPRQPARSHRLGFAARGLGIVTTGKIFGDTMQALAGLGDRRGRCARNRLARSTR